MVSSIRPQRKRAGTLEVVSFMRRLPRNLKEMAMGVCLRFRFFASVFIGRKNSDFSGSRLVNSTFANHLSRPFIIAHRDEGAMSQVPGICPFDKRDLADQLRCNPAALAIFSAVSDSPHREALFSGRFLNGQWTTLSFWRAGKIRHKILPAQTIQQSFLLTHLNLPQ
jgi:hypothetical protein